MSIKYRELMAGKSDKDLQKYLDNYMAYTHEAVEYAIAEMKKRGRVFLDEELTHIRHKMQLKKEEREAEEKEAMQPMDINLVDDTTAPSLYSQSTIYGFGAFNVFLAAVLLAINVNNAGSKKGVRGIIIFGLIYSMFHLWVMSIVLSGIIHVPRKFGYISAVGLIGTFLMLELFWKKYIGKETKYRARPIWTPLVIGILISTPLVFAVIFGSV